MSAETAAEARSALGRVGVLLPVTSVIPHIVHQRNAVRRFEAAGYGATWTNEMIGGKDVFVQQAILLGATSRMAFGTGIANIWARPPQTAHAAAAQLAQTYPGRFTLGLGVGYPQQAESVGRPWVSPTAALRGYVDGMAAATHPATPDERYARILAANGPRLLALAAEIADGAFPAMRPPSFTATARQVLGPDKLLVVLVDATTAGGDPAAVADLVGEHLSAGADHAVVGVPMGGDFAVGVRHLDGLASSLVTDGSSGP